MRLIALLLALGGCSFGGREDPCQLHEEPRREQVCAERRMDGGIWPGTDIKRHRVCVTLVACWCDDAGRCEEDEDDD